MKPNYYHIIDRCIDEGIQSALNNSDDIPDRQDVIDRLTEKISIEIWCQLDMYFNFEE